MYSHMFLYEYNIKEEQENSTNNPHTKQELTLTKSKVFMGLYIVFI